METICKTKSGIIINVKENGKIVLPNKLSLINVIMDLSQDLYLGDEEHRMAALLSSAHFNGMSAAVSIFKQMIIKGVEFES